MLKVAIVYQILAHYREPIFRQLCKSKKIEFTFYADPVNIIDSVKTIDPDKASKSIENGGLRWIFIKNILLSKNLLWQKGVVSLAVNKRYDAIIYLGNAYYISTWLSCLIAKLMGKKIIMWTHGVRKEENGLKGWIRKGFYNLADQMLLYGHYARNVMIDMGLNPDRLTVIYNSLDYDRQVSIRKSISNIELEDKRRTLFQKSELVVLLFIGRLTKSKKLDMILEASFLMKNDGFETNVLIIGDGEERQHLEELVRKYGLENNVVFWGACHNENDLAPLIMLADICVSPGNVGLTCMHSLVYGTPVITHDDPTEQGPEFEAVRPYSTGLFFQQDSVQDLVKSIYDWVNYASHNPNILKSCHKVIDDFYNPYYQMRIIEKSVLDICH